MVAPPITAETPDITQRHSSGVSPLLSDRHTEASRGDCHSWHKQKAGPSNRSPPANPTQQEQRTRLWYAGDFVFWAPQDVDFIKPLVSTPGGTAGASNAKEETQEIQTK